MPIDLDFKSDLRTGKPRLIVISGYGSSGAVFYPMFQYLRTYFRVTTIDLLGMGSSGRPAFNLATARESIEFYIGSLEAWMKTSLEQNEKVYILGHSLSGFMLVHFAIRHPERVSGLILASPAGVPEVPEEYKNDE